MKTRINPGDRYVSRPWDLKFVSAYVNAHSPSLCDGKRQLARVSRSNRVLTDAIRRNAR